MSKFKTNLTCSYCLKICKDPILIPCKDFICREHLTDKNVIEQNKIKCHKCKQFFEVNGSKFKIDNLLRRILSGEWYLSSEEKSLKQKIEESLRVFYQMFEQFKLNKNALDLKCHSHFEELRRQIDLHREILKAKIDEIYIEMIEKTKEFQASYLKSIGEKYEASLNFFNAKTLGEDLKELEDTFRNPKLLIESIREAQIKQEEAVLRLKLNLNELRKVKKHLETFNDFKANLCFNQESFGSFNLNEFFKDDSFESEILTSKLKMDLMKLCGIMPNEKWSLLYRASRDGFDSKDFHSKCDGHANTLTIVRVKGKAFLFGGFTSATWDCSEKYKSDSNAFLFSLTNKENKPCQMKITSHRSRSAIFCSAAYGPTFGGASDIYIASNANLTAASCSNLGDTYRHSRYAPNSNEANSFLAGSHWFQLSDIEVF